MAEIVLWERQLPRNTGFTFELKKGQSVRITSRTIVDFVCFNRETEKRIMAGALSHAAAARDR
jgi:hypothetical protein